MQRILFIIILCLLLLPYEALSAASTYQISPVIVNASGTTLSGEQRDLRNSVGETVVGPTWGNAFSMQAGFFNEYYSERPTPTVTPTVIVTSTPVRTFNGELLHQHWVYAAPNPIRGHRANIVYHLAEAAEVEIKIYTPSNQLVISRRFGHMPAGEHHWYWNTSNIANGVYIMLVKARGSNGKTTKVKKKIALVK